MATPITAANVELGEAPANHRNWAFSPDQRGLLRQPNATLLPILQETAPWLRPEVELPRKGACLESVFWRQVHAVEFGEPHRAPVPEPRGRVAHHHSTVHHFESESSVGITADAVPELNRFSPVA